MVLNFDKTASCTIWKGQFFFKAWNSLSVSHVTSDVACSSLGVITPTACVLVLIQ